MTAVEWLIKELNLEGYDYTIEQAKQMEKEQLHKCASFWRGNENEIEKPIFEQYYKETYGSKGSDEHIEDNLDEIISKAHTNITKRKGKEYAPT